MQCLYKAHSEFSIALYKLRALTDGEWFLGLWGGVRVLVMVRERLSGGWNATDTTHEKRNMV